MNAPLIFADLSLEEALELTKQRSNCTLLVDKKVARNDGHTGTPSVLKLGYVENPPTTRVRENDFAAQIFLHAPEGLAGNWMRLELMTAREMGRILYREHDATTVEAELIFSRK